MNPKYWLFLIAQLIAAALLLRVAVRWPGSWDWIRIAGFVLLTGGLILVFTARWQLGESFSISPQARKLVTRGLYSRVRNPIYVFGSLAVAGLLLVLHAPVLAWIILLVFVFLQMLRARKEASVLEAKFGEEYRTYRRHTWL
jgi:protein-S-isoprenylcysteine O-methyltransferase Ste14